MSRLASLPQGHSHQAQSHVQGPPGEPTRSSADRGLRPPDTSTPSLRPDLQAKAVELEHEMFRNAKAANLYKASVLKKVGGGGDGRSLLRVRVGEAALPHSQAGCHPLAQAAPNPLLTKQPLIWGESTPPLCQLEPLVAKPLRTGPCLVSSCLR